MRITPIGFKLSTTQMNVAPKDFVPTTIRTNHLHDIEFDLIAERVRAANLKSQMNLKLAQLKKNISSFIKQNTSQ